METWHYVAIAIVIILILSSKTSGSKAEYAQDCGMEPGPNASFMDKAKHKLCMNKIFAYSEHNCNSLPYRIAHPEKCSEHLKESQELCVNPGVWGSVCDHMEYLRCKSGAGGEKHICSAIIPESSKREYMGNFNCATSWCGCKPMDSAPKIQRDAYRRCIEKQCGGKPEPGSGVHIWSKFNACVNNGGRKDIF